jgi:hypothetical protein
MNKLFTAGLVLALSSSTTLFAKGEAEPGDVKGEGKGHKIQIAREAEPGDDRGGKGQPEAGDDRGRGKGHKIAKGEAEPGDDRGGKGQPEPGDDRGRGRGKGRA